MTLLTSISLESVQSLEEIFSYLTPEGWVVPAWLTSLRQHVLASEPILGSEALQFACELQPPDELLRRTYH